jgi:hypothetical protein
MQTTFDTRRFFMALAISIGILTIIAIPLGLIGPTKPNTKGYDKAVRAALAEADVNESSASGAPQQQVVNGWLARDLMEVQIKQTNDALTLQHLTVALLVGMLIAITIAGLTAIRTPSAGANDGDAEVPSALQLEEPGT